MGVSRKHGIRDPIEDNVSGLRESRSNTYIVLVYLKFLIEIRLNP